MQVPAAGCYFDVLRQLCREYALATAESAVAEAAEGDGGEKAVEAVSGAAAEAAREAAAAAAEGAMGSDADAAASAAPTARAEEEGALPAPAMPRAAATAAVAAARAARSCAAALQEAAEADEASTPATRARDAHYLFYATTHIVFTLNGFDQTHLGPSLLPAAIAAYLERELRKAMEEGDVDRAAEAAGALRALLPAATSNDGGGSAGNGESAGGGEACSLPKGEANTAGEERAGASQKVRSRAVSSRGQAVAETEAEERGGTRLLERAAAFLQATQSSADGGWQCAADSPLDLFARYHASLVAVAALRQPHYELAAARAAASAATNAFAPAGAAGAAAVAASAAAGAGDAGSAGARARADGARDPAPAAAGGAGSEAVWEGVVFAGMRAAPDGGAGALRAWLAPGSAQAAAASASGADNHNDGGSGDIAGQAARGLGHETDGAGAGSNDGSCADGAGGGRAAGDRDAAWMASLACREGCAPSAFCRAQHGAFFLAARRLRASAALAALPAAPQLPLSQSDRSLVCLLPVMLRLPIRADAMAHKRAAHLRELSAAERRRLERTLSATATAGGEGLRDAEPLASFPWRESACITTPRVRSRSLSMPSHSAQQQPQQLPLVERGLHVRHMPARGGEVKSGGARPKSTHHKVQHAIAHAGRLRPGTISPSCF